MLREREVKSRVRIIFKGGGGDQGGPWGEDIGGTKCDCEKGGRGGRGIATNFV